MATRCDWMLSPCCRPRPASSACWGTSDFFAGLASRRHPAVAVVGVDPGAGAARHLGGRRRCAGTDLTWTGWPPWAVAAGLAGMAGLVCFYSALRRGTMGVVAPIAALGVVVPVVLGVADGRAAPSPWAWVGHAASPIVGVDPGLRARAERRRLRRARSSLAVLRRASGFGFALFCLDRGSRESTLLTLWGMRLTSVTILVVVGAGAAHGRRRRPAARLPALLAIGCGDLAANGAVRLRLVARAGERRLRARLALPGGHRRLGAVRPATSGSSGCSRSGWRWPSVGVAVIAALTPGRPARRVGGCRLGDHPCRHDASTRPPATPSLRASARLARRRARCRTPRCGSCARPAARCRSTARSARASRCSSPACGPDLVTEITLQPVRRHGVDAAIFFSDIVRAAQGGRRRPRHQARRRARSSPSPSAPAPTSTGCRDLTPEHVPYITEAVRPLVGELGATPLIGFAGAPFTLASYLVEGGPSQEPRAHQGADVRRPAAVGRPAAPGSRRSPGRSCGCRSRPAPPPSSCSTRGPARCRRADYQRHRAAALGRGAGRGRPTSACRASTSASAPASCSPLMGEAGADVVGRRLPASRSPTRSRGSAAATPCRATSTRPCSSRRGSRSRPRCARSSTQGRPAPGHIFNLGHGVLPDTDPDVLTRVVELVHEISAR